ncbi:MAG: TPR-repeat-containing protein [Nevskia sp.]|nr:TPR-repeat-containing protein [Nevskia sp.]
MTRPISHFARLFAILVLTAIVYWPGLAGSYLFDDFPNITENTDVHVSTLNWRDWRQAAQASPAKDLPRPLAMLSFAANYYFTGLAPLPMKLTNLCIHLLNGALLYGLLLVLLEFWNERRPLPFADSRTRWLALGLSCAWLLAPINLSSVLYVVQRMESLAQIFVLAGLLLYLLGRRRMLDAEGRFGASIAASGLLFGVVLGALSKESAVLLPLYAFLIELTILRFGAFKASGRRKLWGVFGLLLFMPAALGMAWLLPRILSPGAYASRPFTLGQRLLTETRVLVDYMNWTLFPRPGSLSFYHDDIHRSVGWTSPPATLICSALLLASLAAAIALRRRLPLLALGLGWFFAAHLLTATIIPLELVFEHRNYFASIGLLLAVGALLAEIPDDFQLLRLALPVLGLTAYTGCTALRVQEWGNPVQLAYAEAASHPDSPRANYELGRVLTVTSGYRADSQLIDPALHAFEVAASLPEAGAPPVAALIVVSSHAHREVDPQWWRKLTQNLSTHAPSSEDIGALTSLAACQHSGNCAPDTALLLSAFLAALGHPQADPKLLATYGAFVANQMGDYGLAAEMLRDAIKQSPRNFGYHMELASVLVLEGKPDHAQDLLNELAGEDLSPSEITQIKELRKKIESGSRPKEIPDAS